EAVRLREEPDLDIAERPPAVMYGCSVRQRDNASAVALAEEAPRGDAPVASRVPPVEVVGALHRVPDDALALDDVRELGPEHLPDGSFLKEPNTAEGSAGDDRHQMPREIGRGCAQLAVRVVGVAVLAVRAERVAVGDVLVRH